MTTVAYKNGIMASDTQATNGSQKHYGAHVKKIWEVKGGLIGRSGSADECHTLDQRFLDIESHEDFKNFIALWSQAGNHGNIIFVMFDQPNIVYFGESFHDKEKERDDFAIMTYELEDGAGLAIGSGGDIAEAVMTCGKSAEEAIIVASKHDIYTNDAVDVFEL